MMDNEQKWGAAWRLEGFPGKLYRHVIWPEPATSATRSVSDLLSVQKNSYAELWPQTPFPPHGGVSLTMQFFSFAEHGVFVDAR